jgi:hypothetical protein
MTTDDRESTLRACQRALSTPDGGILMRELLAALEPTVIPVIDALQMARDIANRNTFKLLQELQNGAHIHE